MIKVTVYLDNHQYSFQSDNTIKDILEWSNESGILGLIESKTGRLITIPINKYLVTVEPLTNE